MRGNMDELEIKINEYLDGRLSDEELTEYLDNSEVTVDIGQIMAFRDKVSRIEELYRQIEEPEVPADYWQTFSERVISRLPVKEEEKPPLLHRIFAALFPTNPMRAVKIVGVAAAILIVAIVGDRLMERGDLSYETKPTTSDTKPLSLGGDTPKQKQVPDVATPKSEASLNAVERPFPVTDEDVSPGAVELDKSDAAGEVRENISQPPPKDIGAEGSHGIPEEALKKMREAEPEISVSIESEQIAVPPTTPEKMMGLQDQAVTGTQDESMDDRQFATMPLKASDLANLWVYDAWTADRLITEIRDIEDVLDQLSYESDTYIRYAKMKSSLAILTRDSVDIYDAMNTIDSVIVHQPQLTDHKMRKRRDQLQLLRSRIETE